MKSFLTSALGLIIICAAIVGCFRSCLGMNEEITTTASSTAIEEFDFLSSDPVELKVGEKVRSYFRVEFDGDELPLDNIVFVSSDESVASIKFDSRALNSFVYYNIEAFSEGTATVHVETSDGLIKSEKILVTVTENATTLSSYTTENQEKDGI